MSLPIRIASTSDVHYCPEHRAEAIASLREFVDTAAERRADLVVISGDLFDRAIQASDKGAMPELLNIVRSLLAVAPVVAVYGTPTHDVPGCYEMLTHLDAEHRLTMLYPDTAYYLDEIGEVSRDHASTDVAMILGCPEPGKEWLMANRNGLAGAEANQAVADSMRAVLLGLGGMRREHPELPCVMVYHGAIRGATMGGGQTVGSHEIAVGREDLEMVGADLVLCGHIHEPQSLSDTVHYCGSAYPVDWSEQTQRSFILAEIATPGMTTIERVPYPHAPRVKIVTDAEHLGPNGHDVKGKAVWMHVVDEAAKVAAIDMDSAEDALLARGAVDTRITTEARHVETVRAAEIAQATTLRAKVETWAGASGIEVAESVLVRAEQLEKAARDTGEVADGAHIRLRKLTLRGAIGIMEGLDRAEVTLDLDSYAEGLLAIVGPNGTGKSTLLENLHPYPRMLTRGGSLQSHFVLKDSRRELEWTDERTGDRYRSIILIDPTLATPKAEYHLSRRGDGADESWTPLTNGRKEDYEAELDRLWGSFDLFVRSAFVAQKPPRGCPDLAEATPAERKALFRELGGLDYLQGYADAAKSAADAVLVTAEAQRARADTIRPMLAKEDDKRADLTVAASGLETAMRREASLLAEGKAQRKVVDGLEKDARRQAELSSGLARLAQERDGLNAEATKLAETIALAEAATKGREDAETTVRQAEDLERAKEALNDAARKVMHERERVAAEHAGAVAAHRAHVDELKDELRRMEKAAAAVEARKAAAVATVDAVEERRANARVTCPNCGHGFAAEVAGEQEKLDAAKETVLGCDNELIEGERERSKVHRRITETIEPKAPTLPTFAQQAALDKVVAELARMDVAQARQTIRKAEAADAQIAASRARAETILERIVVIDNERMHLLAQVDVTVAERYAEAKDKLDRLHTDYASAKASVARFETETRALAEDLEDIAEKRALLAKLESEAGVLRAESDEWRMIERACGRDGIQALELDAMGPSIAEVANGLLDAAYGTRFRVEIRTTRIAGRGSKTKQVEDFEIIVHDTERGSEKALDMLSGGEGVWVRKALYSAFGMFRARSTGTRFLTVMLDEADGALDTEARRRYIAMLRAEHERSGRAHTLIVTHSQEAQEAIASHVEMRELASEEVEAW